MPLLTLITACLALVLFWPGFDGFFIYDRTKPEEIWRFFTANLVHFDLSHLVTNLVVFVLISAHVEKRLATYQWLMFCGLLGSVSVIILHFFLPQFETFAGISVISYGFIGLILGWLFSENRTISLLLFGLVGIYQWLAVTQLTSLNYMPVWQLHLFALFVGLVASSLSGEQEFS